MSQVQQATGAYAQKPLLTAIRNTSSSRLPLYPGLPTPDSRRHPTMHLDDSQCITLRR